VVIDSECTDITQIAVDRIEKLPGSVEGKIGRVREPGDELQMGPATGFNVVLIDVDSVTAGVTLPGGPRAYIGKTTVGVVHVSHAPFCCGSERFGGLGCP